MSNFSRIIDGVRWNVAHSDHPAGITITADGEPLFIHVENGRFHISHTLPESRQRYEAVNDRDRLVQEPPGP